MQVSTLKTDKASSASPRDVYRFPGALRSKRRQLGLTQCEIADTVGIDSSRISDIETGREIGPPDHIVDMIAMALCLDEFEHEIMRRAAHRDRRIKGVLRGPPTKRLRLVTALMDLLDSLDDEQESAAVEYLQNLQGSKATALPTAEMPKGRQTMS